MNAAVGLGLVVVATQLDYPAPVRIAAVVIALVIAALAEAAIGAPAWRDRRATAAAQVGYGILGIAAGGALGAGHLLVEGPSWPALLALTALPAGIAVAGAAALRLIRRTRRRWWVAAVPIGFAVLQFLVLPLLLATWGVVQPRTPVSAPMPSGARAVEVVTRDGVTLRAWYTPSRNGAAVIVLPGSGGEKGSTAAHAAVLASHGYGTLALDARGQGDSDGVANAWGWRGDLDIAAAISYLAVAPGVDPARIGVLGLSMGGEQALTAAATDPRLRAVVAEGASGRMPGDVTWLGSSIADQIQRVFYPMTWGFADILTEASPPMRLTQAIARTTAPTLLIVGNDPPEAAAAPGFAAAGAGHLTTWNIPDAAHIQALAVHPDAWAAHVIAFLDEALAPAR
jgi:dienelactone hydrolase